MSVPLAFVERRNPTPKNGVQYPAHATRTRIEIPDQGDPFNARNIIHEGDFYQQGKPWADPGVHINVFSNVPGIQAIAQKFWGQIFTKVDHRRGITTPRGQHASQSGISGDVNVQTPDPVSYGEFATVDGTSRQRIRSAAL